MSEIDCDAATEAAGYEYAMDCMKEEMDELRKDADRYRWIRAKAVKENTEFSIERFDSEVDQAIEDDSK